MTPTVSVVIAARNRPGVLREALASVQRQSFTDFEVIVVDDGSTTDTLSEYRSWWGGLDSRFSLHAANPSGAAGSTPGRGRNEGVKIARGGVLAFLDHDDVWDSADHLGVAIHALETFNADYFFSHVSFIPEYSGPTWAMPPSAVRECVQLSITPSLVDVPRRDFARVMRHYHVHPSHSVMTRDVLKRAGGFIEGLKTADDVNLMLRIADVARRIVYRPDATVAMRFPEGKSFSLASAQIDQTLAEHHAMLDVRVRCHSTDVLKCARSREAWTLRDLAAQVRATNRYESVRLACQALALNPTFGALGDALRAVAALTTSRKTDA